MPDLSFQLLAGGHLETAARSGKPELLLEVLRGEAITAAMLAERHALAGEHEQAGNLYKRAIDYAERAQDRFHSDRGTAGIVWTMVAWYGMYRRDAKTVFNACAMATSLSPDPYSVTASMAPAVKARALARMGQGDRAVKLFERAVIPTVEASPSASSSPGVRCMGRARMHQYAADIYLCAGQPIRAREHARRATSPGDGYPIDNVVGRARAELTDAEAMIRLGEPAGGALAATDVLKDLPAGYAGPLLLEQAKRVARAGRETGGGLTAVRELEEYTRSLLVA